jgi:hypothetical protein
VGNTREEMGVRNTREEIGVGNTREKGEKPRLEREGEDKKGYEEKIQETYTYITINKFCIAKPLIKRWKTNNELMTTHIRLIWSRYGVKTLKSALGDMYVCCTMCSMLFMPDV